MPELATFQTDFARAMARRLTDVGLLSIYRNTSLSGAVEALNDNYPVVRAIVGEAMFRAITVDFATAHPPSSPVLAFYGRSFADWLENEAGACGLPYLADVARIERLHIESLFAPDAPALALFALSNVDAEGWNAMVLDLHPAARLHLSATPAMSIWLAHQSGTPCRVEPEWRPEGALFTRPHSTVQACILDAPNQRFLEAVRRGASVGAAAVETAEHHPRADIGGLFTKLIHAGAFSALPTPERMAS